MNHRLLTGVIVIVVLNGLFLTGCSQSSSEADVVEREAQVQTIVAQTMAAMVESNADDEEVEEDQPEPTLLPSEIPTITPLPTDTPIPTDTLTPTPSIPQVHVDVNTNCRSGPGGIFDLKGYLLVGQQAEVVGQFADGDYWVIKNPSRPGECWLWGNYATLEGPVGQLPYFTPPPTPTPTFTPTPVFSWAGTWTTYARDLGGVFYETISFTVTVAGKNFTAVTTVGSLTVTYSGIISDDNLMVSGTYSSSAPSSGTFKFYALGINQFQGKGFNGVETFAWCGHREGAGEPSPCFRE